MISKENRFHGHGSLRYVYQHGQVVRGPLCSVKFTKNPKRQTYRASIVVSKKVHKSAVVRNRIRRRLYELIRQHAPDFNDVYDIIVTVFSEQIATMPADELAVVVRAQLRQAKIISNTK